MPDTIPLIVAIKQAWTTQGPGSFNARLYFPGGVFNADPPAGTPRPYMVISAVSELLDFLSNQSQFDAGTFDVAVVADTLEDVTIGGTLKPGAGQTLINQAEAAVKALAASLNNANINFGKLRAGDVRYETVDHWWKVTQSWEWNATKAR